MMRSQSMLELQLFSIRYAFRALHQLRKVEECGERVNLVMTNLASIVHTPVQVLTLPVSHRVLPRHCARVKSTEFDHRALVASPDILIFLTCLPLRHTS